MKKKKNKKSKAPQPTKRVQRIRKPKQSVRIMIHDPMRLVEKGKAEKELKPDKVIRFEIEGSIYRVKVNQKNKCLEIDSMSGYCYIQPVSTRNFLIKSNKYKKE